MSNSEARISNVEPLVRVRRRLESRTAPMSAFRPNVVMNVKNVERDERLLLVSEQTIAPETKKFTIIVALALRFFALCLAEGLIFTKDCLSAHRSSSVGGLSDILGKLYAFQIVTAEVLCFDLGFLLLSVFAFSNAFFCFP
jgi:hypothetical protein